MQEMRSLALIAPGKKRKILKESGSHEASAARPWKPTWGRTRHRNGLYSLQDAEDKIWGLEKEETWSRAGHRVSGGGGSW